MEENNKNSVNKNSKVIGITVSVAVIILMILAIVLAVYFNNKDDKTIYEKPVNLSNKEGYGEYVDIGTDILKTENPYKTDWRIFHIEDGKTYLILSDYLPNTYGLLKDSDFSTNGTYGVYIKTTREDFVEKLNTSDIWKNLLPDNLKDNEKIEVKGTPDINLWVKSWNENGYIKLETEYTEDTKEMKVDENTWETAKGYLIKVSENPEKYIGGSNDMLGRGVALSSTDGYKNDLYFPKKSEIKNCTGYWIASESTLQANNMMVVDIAGKIGSDHFGVPYFSLRPIIEIPSELIEKQDNGIWILK